MPKPADIKKRARTLAQEGKIVDAIRVLEELVGGDSIDPYDLVVMGDLCIRGGQASDATTYYLRAVSAYRESALNRNGIALCRKVLRVQPQEKSFVLLLAELCEREGLVLDAVASYLEFAESLDPAQSTGKEPWLESLSRLRPRSVDVLTRQGELLVRWSRVREAVALLRHGAETAANARDRTTLVEMANQIAALGKTGNDAFDAELEAFMDTDLGGPRHAGAPSAPSVSELADIVMPEPSSMILDAEVVTNNGRHGGSALDPSMIEPTSDLEDLSLDQPSNAPLELEPTSLRLDRPIASSTASTPEIGLTAPLGRSSASRGLPNDATELQQLLLNDPFRVDVLERLLETHETDGDLLAAQEIRERLAQTLLKKGDPERALAHFEAYLKVEPSSRTVREQYERLAKQLGRRVETKAAPAAPAPAEAPASQAGQKPNSLFNVRGLCNVEVRDEKASVSADDMVDLGALLDEFREGLKSTMASADPQAHYDMGISHFEMGLFEEAAQAFEHASQDPKYEPEAREMWGRCLRELERFDDAVRVLRAGLALRPESLGVRYQLARALEGLGETAEAVRFYGSITREDPNFEDSAARIRALGGSDCATRPPTVSS